MFVEQPLVTPDSAKYDKDNDDKNDKRDEEDNIDVDWFQFEGDYEILG